MAAETTGLEATRMRKVTSYLFISLDGVVEAPDTFVRSDLYEDFDPLTAEMIAEQDAVLLGRKTYDDWSVYWPQSTIEPFATFINTTPKYVVRHHCRGCRAARLRRAW